jgi:hypothetical protein
MSPTMPGIPCSANTSMLSSILIQNLTWGEC